MTVPVSFETALLKQIRCDYVVLFSAVLFTSIILTVLAKGVVYANIVKHERKIRTLLMFNAKVRRRFHRRRLLRT